MSLLTGLSRVTFAQVGKDGLDQGLDWDTYKRGLKRFARNHKDYVYDDKDDDDDN
jgi:hypothetical protein